jgi:hypothetical protein
LKDIDSLMSYAHLFAIPKVIVLNLTMPTAIPKQTVKPMATNKQQDAASATVKESVESTNQLVNTDVIEINEIGDSNSVTIPAEISTVTSLTSTPKEKTSTLTVSSPSSKSRTAVSSPTTRSQTTSTVRKRTTPDKYVPSVVSTVQRKIDSTASRKKSKKSIFSGEKESKEVELNDDESKLENETEPTISIEKIKELEKDYILKKSLANLQPDDKEVTEASDISERKFFKNLFIMKVRNGSRISWAGFVLGYCREIRLTDYAKQYMKTRKYSFLCYKLFSIV